MGITDFFNHQIVFRFDEFKQFMLSRKKDISESACYAALSFHCKKGKLSHVRRGLYVVNSDSPYHGGNASPFLISGKATDDAVLVHHTALESHGLAYTDFNWHTYLTVHHTNAFSFQGQEYRSIYKKLHSQQDDAKEGFETILLQGINIRRTNLERTLVDVLNQPDLAGGWEEVIRSLERITAFNIERSVNYALLIGSASIAAKLGYFLEQQRPDYLKIDQKYLDRLLEHIPKQVYYIDRHTTIGQGTYIKKWNIIVPNYLHHRQWEEHHHDIDY